MPGPEFLRGERLALAPIERDDAGFLQRGRNHVDVWMPLGRYTPENESQVEQYIEDLEDDEHSVSLLACLEDEPVGVVNARHVQWDRPVLSYWIHPDHHGEGYGREAVGLVLEYLFSTFDVHSVGAHVFETNAASQGLLESLGFVREGRMREARYRDGEYVDEFVYGLLRSEWRG